MNAAVEPHRHTKKKMNGQIGKEGNKMELWGYPLHGWETALFCSNVIAFIAGIFAVAALFFSAIVGYKVTDRVQRDADTKISEAKARTAEAELKLEELKKQVVKQGSRSSLLYGERRNLLVERLKPFAGQKAEVRFCDVSFSQQFIDNEVMAVAMLLQYILSIESKWSVNPLAMMHCNGTGLSVEINSKAPDSTRRAADALLKALKEVPLALVGDTVLISDAPRPSQPPIFDASGKKMFSAPLGVDTIVVTVLAHPL